jgi:hypothetical protein
MNVNELYIITLRKVVQTLLKECLGRSRFRSLLYLKVHVAASCVVDTVKGTMVLRPRRWMTEAVLGPAYHVTGDLVGLTLTSEADLALSSAASRRCESPVLPACLPSIYAYHLCTEFVYVNCVYVNCVYCQRQRQALKQPVML